MDNDGDPFGWLVERCQPTSSQEEDFRDRPFARESEVFPGEGSSSSDSEGFSVETTGIIMVSPPESQSDRSTAHGEEEDFHTPPEHSRHSSEEQRPASAANDLNADRRIDGGVDGQGTEILAVDGDFMDAEGAANLGNDSDNLGFLEPNRSPTINRDKHNSGSNPPSLADSITFAEVFGGIVEEFRVIKEELSKSKREKLRVSEIRQLASPNVGSGQTERTIIETDSNENVNISVIQTEIADIDDGDTMNIDSTVMELGENGGRNSGNRNIDEIDKFKYVSTGKNKIDHHVKKKNNDVGIGGKRELPLSLKNQKEKGKNLEEKCKTRSDYVKKNLMLNDLLDSLKIVFGEIKNDGPERVDFLEMAKKRGMTFPRPRWWPPEGFDH